MYLLEILEYSRNSSDDYIIGKACVNLLKIEGGNLMALKSALSTELFQLVIVRGLMSGTGLMSDTDYTAQIATQITDVNERQQIINDLLLFFRSAKDKENYLLVLYVFEALV